MSIPDFANQVRNVEQRLNDEWQNVSQVWQDDVARRFNDSIVNPYLNFFPQYITGEGTSGMGLEQLLQQMTNYQQNMDSLTY